MWSCLICFKILISLSRFSVETLFKLLFLMHLIATGSELPLYIQDGSSIGNNIIQVFIYAIRVPLTWLCKRLHKYRYLIVFLWEIRLVAVLVRLIPVFSQTFLKLLLISLDISIEFWFIQLEITIFYHFVFRRWVNFLLSMTNNDLLVYQHYYYTILN